uniref:Uncharacterized protein n=1 Tax=Manihot esculenta TaxID=3983 RepID=A0A2C9TZW4_MANES
MVWAQNHWLIITTPQGCKHNLLLINTVVRLTKFILHTPNYLGKLHGFPISFHDVEGQLSSSYYDTHFYSLTPACAIFGLPI